MSLAVAVGVRVGSLADPAGSSSLIAAAGWVQGTLLGSVAVAVATVAVAGAGFMMLAGRIDIRRGIAIVIGVFLLLGSPVIASALFGLAVGTTASEPSFVESPAPPPPPLPPPPPVNADPYAGASVPSGR